MWQKRITVAVVVLMFLLVASVLLPTIEISREAARKTQSRNNLKQIGLALFNYDSTYQVFPSGGIFEADGRGLHGWMTSIYCYFDASPCPEIDFNVPWDSTKNAGEFLISIFVYENPSEPKLNLPWEFPVAHYAANSNLFAVNSFVKIKTIENPANVFLAGELAGGFLPWGCPYNWRELSSLNSDPPTFGRSTRDGCQFLRADGSVKFVSNGVSAEVLNNMKGDDLSGFKANVLNIQIPSAFPCPTDALRVSRSVDGDDLVEVKHDIQGNAKSLKRIRLK